MKGAAHSSKAIPTRSKTACTPWAGIRISSKAKKECQTDTIWIRSAPISPSCSKEYAGHIASVNTCLMEKLGTDPSTEGILRGDQCLGAKEAVPDFTMDEKRQIITDTMKKAASFGLTSLQSNDIGADFSDSGRAFAMMRDIYAKNEAAVRYHYQMCFESPDEFSRFLASEEFTGDLYPEDSWLTLGPLKLYKDGSLGARTAYMKDGYACERDNHGLQWLSCDEMDRYCALARDAGVQVVHPRHRQPRHRRGRSPAMKRPL